MTEENDGDKQAKTGDGFEHLEEGHPSRDRPYSVGRNRPPIENRFPKGVSGNPKGKKKGRHVTSMMRDVLLAPTLIRKRDSEETVPAIVAALTVLGQRAMNGDVKAADKYFRIAGELSLLEQPPVEEEPSEKDGQLVANFIERIRSAEGLDDG